MVSTYDKYSDGLITALETHLSTHKSKQEKDKEWYFRNLLYQRSWSVEQDESWNVTKMATSLLRALEKQENRTRHDDSQRINSVNQAYVMSGDDLTYRNAIRDIIEELDKELTEKLQAEQGT